MHGQGRIFRALSLMASTSIDSGLSATKDRKVARKGVNLVAESQPTDMEVDMDSGSDSDDEVEDDEGDLVTETIDSGINEVINAIRSGSDKLKDKKYAFFPQIGAEGTREAQPVTKQAKPVYLKDYQRQQLLEQDRPDETMAPSYSQEQESLRKSLIEQMHEDSDDNSDDGLLTKRSGPERDLPEIALPDPEKDADGFLSAFVNQKGWLRKSQNEVSLPTYDEVVDNDDDNEEFDDLSEKFESAYNFRFEDPEAAEIVSYARDQNTLRRDKLSARQKKREKEKLEKQKEEEQKKLEKAKIKKSKVAEITKKMAQLQEALGEGSERVAEMLAQENLDGDFDENEWDKRMQQFFDQEYYGNNADVPAGEDFGEDISVPASQDTKLDIKEGPRLTRQQLKRKAEQFVDSNQDLIEEEMLPTTTQFRYREVEPESFGLTAKDILLASDQDLNQFVGIKKLASYRDRQRMEADRKRYSKSKRLRKWRQEVFGTETAPTDDAWEKAKLEAGAEVEEPPKKHKKHKKNKK